VFCRRAYSLWCPKSRWIPPLGVFVALQISENGLEVRKLWPFEGERVVFTGNS